MQRLKEETAKCMGQFGIRRTTVDEIVKRVKIPKGTFYLFYKSKELLQFEVILEIHDQIEQEFYCAVQNISRDNWSVEQISDIIFDFFKRASESPVLKMISPEDIELLVHKLPPEILQNHLEYDNDMVSRVFSALPLKKKVNEEIFSAAFRGIYFSTLHKEEIGEENYDEALRLLIRGLILQLV